MSLLHSPRRTRSQVATGAGETPTTATATESEALRSALQELERLREERRQEKELLLRRERELEDLRRQKEEELRRREERPRRGISGESFENLFSVRAGALTGVKIRADIFDGSVPWREFLAQFELVARANGWNDAARATVLATSLRGEARSVLEGLEEDFSYREICSKLELRYGERGQFQNYYTQFTNRRQKSEESFAALGADLERLARLAYPECAYEVREKIACAQFIVALSDRFVKRTLQLENVSSLRAAVERAGVVKVVQESSFEGGKHSSGRGRDGNGFRRPSSPDRKERSAGERCIEGRKAALRKGDGERECWKCGKKGHFRYECPANLSGNKG